MSPKLKIYQVDAFAAEFFKGNPAAVIPLENWLSDSVMQKIAMENNLSETAFFIPDANGFQIRWFTPVSEVDLCGHATLAAAHVVFEHLQYKHSEINFSSKSGLLKVAKQDELIILDFPASDVKEVEFPENLYNSFNFKPKKCFRGRYDYMLVFENENQIHKLSPDFQKLIKINTRGVICTAKSNTFDFVSRFFAPAVGVNEDPVTGSAHTMLIPYWARVLGKNKLNARQLSKRSGILYCEYLHSRVKIGGRAITFLKGEIFI